MKLPQSKYCALLLGAAMLMAHGICAAQDGADAARTLANPLPTNQYMVTNLASNASSGAPFTDANMVNPWGMSRSSGSPWWLADNGTGLSTLYTGTGQVIPLVVTIPAAKAGMGQMGSPTGTIFNGTTEFDLPGGSQAIFLFATEDGKISGWNPKANPTNALIAVNESQMGASFKGLTAATVNMPGMTAQTLLYVADFTLGRVEVFDGMFHHVSAIEDQFNQSGADMPDGFAPFNVQDLGGNIFVSYAKLGSGINEQDGPGLGRVRVYTPDGRMVLKLESGSWMNAPWGMAIAPSDFGPYSHSILVGNFGSGWIAAFDPITGKFEDFLRGASGKPLGIAGLWGISPGNDGKAGNATSLYFAAGGANESTGTFGSITAMQNPLGNAQ